MTCPEHACFCLSKGFLRPTPTTLYNKTVQLFTALSTKSEDGEAIISLRFGRLDVFNSTYMLISALMSFVLLVMTLLFSNCADCHFIDLVLSVDLLIRP